MAFFFTNSNNNADQLDEQYWVTVNGTMQHLLGSENPVRFAVHLC